MKDRSSFILKFEKTAKDDPRVLAAFLGGSLADGTEDDYSDIDIYYLVDEEYYGEFLPQVRTLLDQMGQLTFYDSHNNFGFDLFLFIFRNGVKGELGLGTTKNLKTLHAGPYKVLVDKKGLLKGVVFPYHAPLQGNDLRAYVEKQMAYYWYWYNVFLSATARGRLWSAFSQLQQMRQHAFNLMALAHQPEKIPGQRFERTVPQKVREELGRSTLPLYSRESMIHSAEALTEIVKRETRELVRQSSAEYPLELESIVSKKKVLKMKQLNA
jgi:Streptomycin adenylyltransferase